MFLDERCPNRMRCWSQTMAEVKTTFWFCTLGFSISAATQWTQAFCHRWCLGASLRRRVSGGLFHLKWGHGSVWGPFLKVSVALFLYLRANVMELNTKCIHFIETFRTLKNEKLRNEASWGGCAGAERLDFHSAGVSGSSPLRILDL